MVNTKKKRTWLTAVMLMLMLAFPLSPLNAASLWSDNINLYADHRARAVGDIITIIISESSSASRVGKADNSKSSSTEMKAGTGIFHWIADAKAGASDNFKAQGSIANSNRVNARMTAQVKEILPNGDMMISGTQSINQNGEEQKIIVTGTIRPDDISSDNTVLSTYVANAEIHIDGKGPISSKQRQGILTQLLNILF